VVDDEWQCGQFMAALSISQNGPGNLFSDGAFGKLPRDLTEPARRRTIHVQRVAALRDLISVA